MIGRCPYGSIGGESRGAANNRPAGTWYNIPLHLGGAAEPTDRWLRLWQLFEDPANPADPIDTIEEVAEIAFDPVRAPLALLVAAAQENYSDIHSYAQQALDGPVIFESSISADVDYGFAEWLDNGAKSLYQPTYGSPEGVDPFSRLRVASLRFNATYDQDLIDVYGNGADAALVLLRDLAECDYDPACVDASLEDDILLFLGRVLGTVRYGAPGLSPVVASDAVNLSSLPYFGHADKFGGTIPSQDTSMDIDLATTLASDFRYQMTFDKNTLWSAHSKVYSHDVDLSSPTTSGRAIHPIGNVESSDLPDLGDLATIGITDLWWKGAPSSGTHYDALELAKLSDPTVTEKTAALSYAPRVSYYGPDYGGWDPHRAPSIELVTSGPYTAGQTVDLLVSNLPLAKDFEIDEYAPTFDLEYDVTVYMDDAPDYDATAAPIVVLVDQTGDSALEEDAVDEVTVSISLPTPLPDVVYFQAVAELANAGSLPTDPSTQLDELFPPPATVTTMGLRIDL